MFDIHALFTPAEVEALNAYQRSGWIHPLTCPDRGDGKHREHPADRGLLVATEAGWACPDCAYTQSWAHAFMAGSPPGTVPPHDRRRPG